MFDILDIEQLQEQEITIKQRLRIFKSRKKYAVFVGENLYLINDLERLFFDRLKHENVYYAQVYQLR